MQKGSYEADMVFKCTGLRPASKLLIDLFGEWGKTNYEALEQRTISQTKTSDLKNRKSGLYYFFKARL